MKKIISLLAVMALLCMSFTAFAAGAVENDNIHVTFVADKATIAPGEDVTVSAYITANGTSAVSFDTLAMFGMIFDMDNFSYEVVSTGSFAVEDYSDGFGLLWASDESGSEYATDAACVQVKFTANAEAAEGVYAFDVSEDSIDTGFAHGLFVYDMDTGNVTLTGTTVEVKAAGPIVPEPEEEVFEITKTEAAVAGTDTMKDENGADVAAAGDKVVAIFAKNISDAELAAGSYGIVFGGVRYAGQLAVPAKTAWAIKLVGSAEQLPAGNYAYGIFAGEATVDAATPWVID